MGSVEKFVGVRATPCNPWRFIAAKSACPWPARGSSTCRCGRRQGQYAGQWA